MRKDPPPPQKKEKGGGGEEVSFFQGIRCTADENAGIYSFAMDNSATASVGFHRRIVKKR